MSGPKVIRLVTREEIMAICEQHLAKLDAALEAWMTAGHRHGLLDKEAFPRLQEQAPKEIAFLASDMQSRLADAIAKAAAERTRQRRRVDAAMAVAAELQAKGVQVPPSLSASLVKLASGADGEMADDRVFAEAFGLLAKGDTIDTASERTREIAARLSGGSLTTSFAEWRLTHLEKDDDDRLRIDAMLAELSVLDAVAAITFEPRVRMIGAEQVAARKRLLVDSVIVDLAKATRNVRDRNRVLAKLREQAAVLGHFTSDPARALAAEMNAAVAASGIDGAASLLAAADTLIAAETSRLAADARREAILRGLSSLGYEVREGMATAFAKGNAVVMRHANTPGFGVEISGPPEAQRLQMRVVAFSPAGAQRDSSRDRDIELQWCGNVDKLRELLAGTGGEITIERAAAAGALPLKVIGEEVRMQEPAAGEAVPKRHVRTLQTPRR
jgi:hypothetical protein